MDAYEILKLDNGKVINSIVDFIRRKTKEAGLSKAVVSMSGGIDSTLVAFLTVEALGKENVFGFSLPYKLSDPNSIKDASEVAEQLGIHFEVIPITNMVDSYADNTIGKIRRGNILARTRMLIIFDQSKVYDALVMGTCNKTEVLLGYFTAFGDGAASLDPIASLYKTQVRILSKQLGVPESIINKDPSADLWVGQTDEDELGVSYEDADLILYYMFDKKLSMFEIEDLGFTRNIIEKVYYLYKSNSFKSLIPIVAPIEQPL
jgi:NAD+ synthase